MLLAMTLPPTQDEALPDRVLVYTRVKPTATSHVGEDDAATRVHDLGSDGKATRIAVRNPNAAVPSKTFVMDQVLGPRCTQKDVYNAVGAPVLDSVLRGCHGCVLAYGQTGSGKTHSMLNLGEEGHEDAGIMPRLAVDLFARIAADWTNFYDVEIAMIQIYNESAMDLLTEDRTRTSPSNAPYVERGLKASQRKPSEGGGWELLDCTWYRCKTPEYLLECFRHGRKRLVYADTMMNKQSSRSHCVLQLRVNRVPRLATAAVSGVGGKKVELVQQCGLLTVVDMAGSERVKKTLSEGVRFNEATNINTSLLAFGNVVQALAAKRPHVPYRESMLTKLLESSLSGSSRTALLVCVAPEIEHAQESTTALEFASRCMRVQTTPRVHTATKEIDPATLAKELAEGMEAMTAMESLGEQVLYSQQLLHEEKQQRAKAEDHLCDVINRERKERAAVEGTLQRRVAELETELKSMRDQLEDTRTKAVKSTEALEKAVTTISDAEKRCAMYEKKCRALEADLEAERKNTQRESMQAAASAEEELRELLRRNNEDRAKVEENLRASLAREKKARVEAEEALRVELEREQTERATTEAELREALEREKTKRTEIEGRHEEVLERERNERAATESELREMLRNECKGRAEMEEKLQLRVTELQNEIASVTMQLSDAKRDAQDVERRLSCAVGDIAEVEDRCLVHCEKVSALRCELETERESAKIAAQRAADSAESRLSEALDREKAERDSSEDALRRALAEENEQTISALRKEFDAAEQRILERVHELEDEVRRKSEAEATARLDAEKRDSAYQALEHELERLRSGWRDDLTELQRASAMTANDAETSARARLASGISVAKRGRNGKIYRRMIRCHLQTNTLEWAPLGSFRKMSIQGGQMSWASDGSSFVVRGPKRDIEVEVTDSSVMAWGRALYRRLPVSEKQLTPLRYLGVRSTATIPDCPKSPTANANAVVDAAAKKRLALRLVSST